MNELVIDIAGELAARRGDVDLDAILPSATASTLMIRLALELLEVEA